MNSTLQKLALTAGLALSLSAISPQQAQALSLFSFKVTPDSGLLNGETYFGDFSFDETGLTGTGTETVPLSSFNFNLLGTDYSQADGTASLAEFLNGQFLGIDYTFDKGSDVKFSFVPGVDSLTGAYFAYNGMFKAAATSGFGDIAYTAVPTPALLPGLLGMGIAVRRRKGKKNKGELRVS